MRLGRKIAIASATLACSLLVAACGEQIAAHVQASDSVHAGLTSVFSSPTTQFVITAQNLPGQASIADGSFSIVVTTSQESASNVVTGHRAVDVSIDHEATNLIDLRYVNGAEYLRLDLKDLTAFASAGTYASISATLNKLAAHPGLGYLHDILAGSWVGVSTSTLLSVTRQIERGLPSANKPTFNLNKIGQLRMTLLTSFLQSVRTWLSVHQTHADEYALTLPIRSFVGSLLHQIAKPLAAYLKEPFPAQAELGTIVNRIPANLSVHANMWVQNGSMTKLQIFIPDSSASVLIGISHPASPVQVPSGATMLTASNLTQLFGTATSFGTTASSSLSVVSSSLGAVEGT
jgi:hypothetical protein